jgi:hypothetical protein
MRLTIVVRAVALTLALALTATVARAGEKDFDLAVDQIKQQYHGKKQGGFGLFLARMAVKMIKPAGVKSFKFAIFENLSGVEGGQTLQAALRNGLKNEWRPLVRTYSKHDREQTYIYIRPKDKDVEVLVVAVEDTEATVVKARIDPIEAAKWVEDNQVALDSVESMIDGIE